LLNSALLLMRWAEFEVKLQYAIHSNPRVSVQGPVDYITHKQMKNLPAIYGIGRSITMITCSLC
jgi:hypothetical protein